ncbi:MAG: hypothetical protein Q4A09_07565 [Capnocytophaga felis]|nr:hypothetical protein [Capnocytophaga felis]
MKTVTPKQIERLYEFTRQHYVEYYDVQTELVDHLANAIETHWKTHPNDDFETVLQKEFRKFGVFGFMDVLEEKMKQMSKRYNRMLWQKTKEFFTIPKIILTLCIGIVIYLLLSLLGNINIIVPVFFLTILIVFIVFSIKNRCLFKQKNEKKWLLEDTIIKLNNYSFILFLFFQMLFQFREDLPQSKPFLVIYAAFFTFAIITMYVATFHIPKNKEKYLSEIYPEYKIQSVK